MESISSLNEPSSYLTLTLYTNRCSAEPSDSPGARGAGGGYYSEGEASDYRKSLCTDLRIASSTRTFAPPTPWAQPCFARRSIAQTPRLARLRQTRASHRAPAASVRGLRLRPSARSCSAVLRRRPSSEVRLGAFVSGARAAVGFSTGRGGSCAPLPKNATRVFDNGRNAAHALAPPPLFPDSLAHSAQKNDLFQRGKAFSRAHDTRSRGQPLPETLAARTSGCARCAAPSILAVAPLPARLVHCGCSRISCWKLLLARVCRRLFRRQADNQPLLPTRSMPPQHRRRGGSLCMTTSSRVCPPLTAFLFVGQRVTGTWALQHLCLVRTFF